MRIKTKEDRRDRIKHRIRKRVRGTEARPRLTIFRSVSHIYVQVVDDMAGTPIASASTVEPAVKGALPKAATVNVTLSPTFPVTLAGCDVIVGGIGDEVIVSAAALEVTVP